jgi:hypothetical protein
MRVSSLFCFPHPAKKKKMVRREGMGLVIDGEEKGNVGKGIHKPSLVTQESLPFSLHPLPKK